MDKSIWPAIQPAGGETLRAALERTLRDAIRSEALREGVRLPASRLLAEDLGVSRGVVTDAYLQLEAQGFLVIRPREAPLVASVPPAAPDAEGPPEPRAGPRFDLTPADPDLTLFPFRRWAACVQKVHRTASPTTLGYADPRGVPALREALADHLGRARGVIATPDQVVIVQGAAQGIDIVLRALEASGVAKVAVEDPSHVTQHQRIRSAGMDLVPRPVDAEGMIVDGLHADAVLVTPAHQFPTGCVLSGERRRALLEWSRRGGGLIIEDDYDSDFRYDREPVGALQGLAPDQVIQVGTVSKTLAPALRLGWLVAPRRLIGSLVATKRLVDDFSPTITQLALAELLRRGDYDRQVRRARAAYRHRRDALLAALAGQLPGLTVEGIAAGVHLLIRLPAGVDDAAVAAEAERRGVRLPPLSSFRIVPGSPGGLVLGYGRLPDAAISTVVDLLVRIIRAAAQGVPEG